MTQNTASNEMKHNQCWTGNTGNNKTKQSIMKRTKANNKTKQSQPIN